METIDEQVSVNLLNNKPIRLFWHGRQYTLTQIGFHHTVREGRTLILIFSVTDGATFFKLRLDTETLLWKLLEVADGV